MGLETLPTTLPDEIRARLATVRHKLRMVEVLLGLSRALLAIAAAVVVSFILDKSLEPPLEDVRSFAIFVFGSAAAVAAWFLVVPWRRKLDDDTVAVAVERAHDGLDDVLVSAVQLSRALESGEAGFTSAALIGSTIQRAAARTRDLDFGAAIDARPLFPAYILTGASWFALIAFAVVQPDIARAYVHRVILWEDATYPKPIDLEVSVPRESAVASGDDVVVDVHATRGASRVERIVVRTQFVDESGREKGSPEVRPLLQVGEGRWRKVYQNVTDSFAFKIDAGMNVVTSPYKVRVVARPRIEAARFWLRCPDYTGIPATPDARPVTEPDLRVPVGTEIRYEAIASSPLSEAKLVFERDLPGAPAPAKGGEAPKAVAEEQGPAPALGGEGKEKARKLAGSFVVTKSMRFRFAIKSTEGYDDGKKPVVFSVTAVVDRPPEVRIPVPGRTKQASPRAIVPLEVEIKEDYGIDSAELRWVVESSDGNKAEEKRPLRVEAGAKQATIKTELDLAGMAVKPGDRVVYRGVAFDRNIDVGKREGDSPPYVVMVMAIEDITRLLQDRIARLKDELRATAKLERATRDEADAEVRALQPKQKLDQNDKQKLAGVEAEQRKVTSLLQNVAQELERIAEEREQNRIGDQRELEWIQTLRDEAKELAEKDSPLVSRELEDANKQELDEKSRAKLARVPDLMEKVEDRANRLADSIDKRGDYTDIIREVRDILGEQERITGGTEQAIKSSSGQGR